LLMSLPTHGYECRTMAFNSDGTRLLTVLGGVAKLIDAAPEMSAFGSNSITRAEQNPAEAEAARWVLEQGGQVQVRIDDAVPVDVNQVSDLPPEAFVVRRISLGGKDTIEDADLAVLKRCKYLIAVRLDLRKLTDSGLASLGDMPTLQEAFINGTQITDGGLQIFSNLSKLRVLHANDTPIQGAGLANLKACPALEAIELHRTQLDDAGLATLAELPALKFLGIAGTKVTDDGVAQLKAKRPQLNIGR